VDWKHLAQVRRPIAGSCEHSNESSGSVKGEEFLNWLSDY
jgi:hypothetical protein